ncbi:MAG: site-2 protease family protein [bacterium]
MILETLFENPIIFIIWLAAIIIPIALHEFAHAFAATIQGDPTPKSMGRLTFNPLAHIDPLGIILLLIAGFGWGKPTPFNPFNLRNTRWGTVLVAAAGPISNLIMIIFFGLLLKILYPSLGSNNLLSIFLIALVQINIILMVFNLIPIPPLDGSKVLFGFINISSESQARFEKIGPMLLLGLIILERFSGIGFLRYLFSGMADMIFSLI